MYRYLYRSLLFALLMLMTSIGTVEGEITDHACNANAQQDSLLSMEDAITYRNGTLSPKYIYGFAFVPEEDSYSMVDRSGLSIFKFRQGGEPEQVQTITLSQLNNLLASQGQQTQSRWPSYIWLDRDTLDLWIGTTLVRIDRACTTANVIFNLPAEADNVHLSPSGEHVVFNLGERIEIMDHQGKRRVITADTARGIVNGRTVHRNEFGIEQGIFWSPDGRRVAFYRMDESMVAEYPLVDATTRIASLIPERYPMAGCTSHQVTLGIYDVEEGTLVWVQKQGGAEDYLTNVTWSFDGEQLYIAELNRAQNHMKLNRFDAHSGRFERTVIEERSRKYVEPLAGPHFIPGREGEFLWESERSGHNHLYHYSAEGKLLSSITKGEWDVIEFHGFSYDAKKVYIVSTEQAVLDRHLYEVPLNGKARRKLSTKEGVNQVQVDCESKRYSRFVSFWNNMQDAGGVYIGIMGKTVGEVEVLRNSNPLKGISMPSIELVTLKAADGRTPLYGRLIRPRDIKPGQKLPTVIYVYGGPHAQLVTNSWLLGAPYWELLMAQRGYVIFVLDNRGSAGRGSTFEQSTHLQLGEVEMADQMRGVQYLKGLDFVDSTRMGVHGWSYGGFMTISLLLRQGDIFKVGVAGGPVIDWKLYEVMYGERYMGTPDSNPEGYNRAALTQYAENLKGRHLLILHGYQDPVVVPQHTLQFMKACVEAGEYTVDSFWYIGHPHNVRGRDRIHLMNKVTDYFDTYLK